MDRTNELRTKIELICYDLDTENCLDALQKRWMAEQLTAFVTSAANKFIEGQREHGGDFDEVQGVDEAKKEVLDLFWYLNKEASPMKLWKSPTS